MRAWWHAFVSTPILLTNAALPAWLNPITRVIGDAGTARGADLPYQVARVRTEYALQRLPLYCGPWRGLGAGPNALAVESAVDEAARAAGTDPLAFRIAQAFSPRLVAVLRRAAEAAGWGEPGVHQGIACGIYKGSAFAAVVAEVAVREGRWVVVRLSCAVDSGRIVNPNAVQAQTEGNLVWGLGMVFGAALPVADGGVTARGMAEAGLPRLSEVPPMDIVLVESAEAPGGAGETAIVAAAAAVANALRGASGRRPTRFPLDGSSWPV
jgi:isoquinoline 1-oxidoreductase beta subunit